MYFACEYEVNSYSFSRFKTFFHTTCMSTAMIEIGKINSLTVIKHVAFGVYLDGEDLGEILLPRRYVPEDCQVGDAVDVFLYYDSEDRLIATTEKPYAMVDDIACLKVVAVTSFGAFMDWGLPKDLLVPFSEQSPRMVEGQSYIVKLFLDDRRHRIVATAKVERFFAKLPVWFREGQGVSLVVHSQTNLGYKAIVNESYWGILYQNEVFQPLSTGQKISGYITKIRENGTLDLSLQKPGYQKVDPASRKILAALAKHNGFIAITDKSPPEEIYALFSISKKTYKKAVGALYKRRFISLLDNGIKLNVEQ